MTTTSRGSCTTPPTPSGPPSGTSSDWGLAGTRAGQYRSDLAADAAGLGVLERAGVGVLSEESGRHAG